MLNPSVQMERDARAALEAAIRQQAIAGSDAQVRDLNAVMHACTHMTIRAILRLTEMIDPVKANIRTPAMCQASLRPQSMGGTSSPPATALAQAVPSLAPSLRFCTTVSAGNTTSDKSSLVTPSFAAASSPLTGSSWSADVKPLFASAWSEPSGFTARAQLLAAAGNTGWGRPAPSPSVAAPATASATDTGEERGDSDPEREADVQFTPAITELPPEVLGWL
jgi:hypothetical protein